VLAREEGFNAFAIFREIDVDGDGQINKEEVGDFLREAGFHANESETLAIVRRMDTNGNWHVSYDEFNDFLTALSPAPKPINLGREYLPKYTQPSPYRSLYNSYKYWDPLLGRYVYDSPY
jgi:hypothetical protein